MFARFLALLPLALLASASHLEARGQCDTGSIHCCNSVQTLNDANGFLSVLDLVGVAESIGGLVGLTCSPVSVIGGSNSCTQEPVCCSHNEYNGLVNLGCSPINIYL